MLATLTLALTATLALVGAAPPAAADDIRDQQWHLDYLDITEAHQTTQGQGVTVAVIDTGVQADHPDLRNNVLEGTDFDGNTKGQTDEDGHGTRMANMIAGHGRGRGAGVLGIAPEAKILPVRVDLHAQSEQTAQAIRWAADSGAEVINVSLGHSDDNPSLRDAVSHAQAQDALVVASVGNTFDGDYIVHHPSQYPGVVAVSAVGRSGEFAPDISVEGEAIDIAAPGKEIATGDGQGYALSRGTSASAAIVSGVAALVRAQYPDLDAANVINRLVQTADDKGPDGRDPQYGFGVVDPTQALNADIPQTPTNPLGTLTEQTPTPDQTPADTPTSQTAPPPPDNNTTNTTLLLTAAGIGILALAVVAISAIALARTRRRPANPTGPHPPTASGPQPPPAPPPGPRPHPPPNQPGPPNQPPPRRPPPPPPPTGR